MREAGETTAASAAAAAANAPEGADGNAPGFTGAPPAAETVARVESAPSDVLARKSDEIAREASGAPAAAVAAIAAQSHPAVGPEATVKVASVPAAVPARYLKRKVYGASGLRKTMLSFLFMLLLPFYGSLGPMLFQRWGNVPTPDLIGFVLMATAFTLLMLLILFELILSIRSRVELGDRAIRFTLPARGGIIPAFSYASHEIPYDQIDAIEVRREVYGGALAPVLLRGVRIVTVDGQKIPLGYVSEANEDAVIPFPEIGDELCARIGRSVVDRGSVRRMVRKKLMRVAASAEENKPIGNDELAALNRSHNRFVLSLVACLVVLVGVGIWRDVMSMTVDQGERAANTVPPPKGRS